MDWYAFIDPDMWIKIGLSVLCGVIVGIERELHKKPMDVRTSVLICLGTMLFIFIGEQIDGSKDSTRVLGQVATGIGFLGAGAIITRQGFVIGLTSATVVWVLAAVGSAIGFGFYELGVTVSVVTVVILSGLHFSEKPNRPDIK